MILSSRKQAQDQVQYYQVFEERHWCTDARLELPIHHYTSSERKHQHNRYINSEMYPFLKVRTNVV